jgi:hypothetical protein
MTQTRVFDIAGPNGAGNTTFSARSHAPAWECRPAAPAARLHTPSRTTRRWSVGPCSHAGAWEPDADDSLNVQNLPMADKGEEPASDQPTQGSLFHDQAP